MCWLVGPLLARGFLRRHVTVFRSMSRFPTITANFDRATLPRVLLTAAIMASEFITTIPVTSSLFEVVVVASRFETSRLVLSVARSTRISVTRIVVHLSSLKS